MKSNKNSNDKNSSDSRLRLLGAAIIVGLIISILQAVTQVQDQTLSFVPKVVGMGIVAVLAAPWIARMWMEYAQRMFSGGS